MLAVLLSVASGIVIILGGVIFNTRKNWDPGLIEFFLAIGAGYILAVAILDMIPAAYEISSTSMFYVVLGYFIVHLFEHVFTGHFHFGEETHEELVSHSLGLSAMVGLMVHNLFSGIAIGSGFMTNFDMGLMIFAGIVLHKLPEGFTISSIVYVASHKKRKGTIATVILAVSSVVGTILVYVLDSNEIPFRGTALALAAGAFIHVAATDLIPQVNESRSKWIPLMIFIGFGLFGLSHYLLSQVGAH